MKPRALALALLVFLLASPATSLALGEPDSVLKPLLPRLARGNRTVTAFRDVNVIPMDSARVLPHQTVVVSGSRIVAFGPAAKTVIPTGATVIDGTGRYLIPGLIDMHFHMPSPGINWTEVDAYLEFFVANGVTTVRSTIGSPDHPIVRRRMQRGEILSPSLYLASPPIGAKNTASPEEGRRKIFHYRSDGFDCIKLFEIADTTLFGAVTGACREAWLPCFGHVDRALGLARALRSMRSIEHLGPYLTPEGTPVPTLAGDVAATRAARVWNCPTQFFHECLYSRDLAKVGSYAGVSLVRQSVRDEWNRQKTEAIGKHADKEAELATRRRIIKALRDGGVRLLVGSDSPGDFRVPGFAMVEEMRSLHRAGMTPYEVLDSATRLPADYFSALREFGTVEVGKRADLILLNANPLQDIDAVLDQAGVMLRGAWLPRSVLDDAAKRHAAAFF